MNGIEQHHITV